MKAYSYKRWSSDKQTGNDSLYRQTESAKKICEIKKWELDESLDPAAGISAWRGDNHKEGSLAKFKDAVANGAITTPCVLVIDEMSRFSRQKNWETLKALEELFNLNVTVCTANDGKEFNRDSLNNLSDLLVLIVNNEKNNKHVEDLSEKVGGAWKRKKIRAADGVKVTRMVPAWIKINYQTDTDGKLLMVKDKPVIQEFSLNEKADTVKRIFNSYADGKGVRTIMKELNRDNVSTFGKGKQNRGQGWSSTHLRRLLSDRNVLGEYQPCKYVSKKQRIPDGPPICDYYPPVIEKDLFYRVQDILSKQQGTGGYKKNATNLFTGIVKCHCGASMVIKRSPKQQGKYLYVLLVCNDALRGKRCAYHTIQYAWLERAVLTVIWTKILPFLAANDGRQAQLEKQAAELKDVQAQIKKWMAVIEEADAPLQGAGIKLNALETRASALNKNIEALSATINDNPLVNWKHVPNTMDNRFRLGEVLKKHIDTIVIDARNRRALLNIKDPDCQFEITWPVTKGANKIKRNEANEGFLMFGKKFSYLDQVFVWKSPDNMQIQDALNSFKCESII